MRALTTRSCFHLQSWALHVEQSSLEVTIQIVQALLDSVEEDRVESSTRKWPKLCCHCYRCCWHHSSPSSLRKLLIHPMIQVSGPLLTFTLQRNNDWRSSADVIWLNEAAGFKMSRLCLFIVHFPPSKYSTLKAPGKWQNFLFQPQGMWTLLVWFSSVQSLSHVRLFVTPWITARQAPLSITISRSSLRLMSIELVMPSSHLILCCPLLLLPPIPPSIRVFSNESTLLTRWPKYWSFSFSIIPSKEIPDWSPSEWTGWISLQSKGLSRVFSNTTLQKHQFFGAQLSSQSNCHIHTWSLEKP